MTNRQPSGNIIFENVSPTNPPRGSESWPIVAMREDSTVTVFSDTAAKPPRPPITILEPKEANNVTAEEETWPIAEFGSYGGITTVDDLSHQLAERIAAAPPEKRAELQARVNADIARAVAAAAGPVA